MLAFIYICPSLCFPSYIRLTSYSTEHGHSYALAIANPRTWHVFWRVLYRQQNICSFGRGDYGRAEVLSASSQLCDKGNLYYIKLKSGHQTTLWVMIWTKDWLMPCILSYKLYHTHLTTWLETTTGNSSCRPLRAHDAQVSPSLGSNSSNGVLASEYSTFPTTTTTTINHGCDGATHSSYHREVETSKGFDAEGGRQCAGFRGSKRGSAYVHAPFLGRGDKDLFSFFFALDSSEYLASCDKRRAFISGFNGSAGTCIGLNFVSSVCSLGHSSRLRDRHTG